MRKLLTVLVLGGILLLAIIRLVSADCMACWELKGITLELKDGKEHEGYIIWNDAWVQGQTSKSFPDLLFDNQNGVKTITFYLDIRAINYPDSGLKVSVGLQREIPVDSISHIKLKAGVHDGYVGAGRIPVVSERTAQMLLTKPVATCTGKGPLSIVTWLSYNQRFGKEELDCLCNPELIDLIQWSRDFEGNKLVRLEFSYD
jgi:hypothetical protein